MKREAILGAATLLVCAVLYHQTTLIADYGFAQVGADVWPKIILGSIAALALVQLAMGLRSRPTPANDPDLHSEKQNLWESAFVPVTVFSVIILFAVLVPYIGFMFSGLLMVFSLLTVIGPRSARAIAINAAIASGSVLTVTFFFSNIMGVLLPGWAL